MEAPIKHVDKMSDKEGAREPAGKPLSNCTFCGKQASDCSDGLLDAVVTRNLIMALELCQDKPGLNRLSKGKLPVCGSCRDKVILMVQHWQQLRLAGDNFNLVRKDLAFTIIESMSTLPVVVSPRTQIRQMICDDWKTEYDEEKKSLSSAAK